MFIRLLACGLLLGILATASLAQEGAPSALAAGTHEFGIAAGGSFTSPILWGKSPDRKLFISSLRYGYVFLNGDDWALRYTADIVPVALLNQPRPEDFTRRETVYAAGVTPVGFNLSFRRRQKAKPFANMEGGMLYFQRQVPLRPDNSQFNFTVAFGSGVQVAHSGHSAVTLGVQYMHISNLYTARSNPGVDNVVFYARWSRFKRF